MLHGLKLTECRLSLAPSSDAKQPISRDAALVCTFDKSSALVVEFKVDYLNKELKLNEDMKKAQQDQYDKEVSADAAILNWHDVCSVTHRFTSQSWSPQRMVIWPIFYSDALSSVTQPNYPD